MADEPAAQSAPAPAAGTDLGGTLRVTPQPQGEANPTLEETAAAQALANETEEQKAAREAGEAAAGPKVGEETPEQKAAREAEEAKAPLDFKGTVFEGLSEEMQGKIAPFAAAYKANGTLTDAEVAEAATSTGFSEAAVRQFMAGATATRSAAVQPIYDTFGGQDQYKAFQGWTQTEGNLTEAEARTINKALGINDKGELDASLTPDPEMAAQLMKAPMERWKADGGGKPPRDVTDTSQGGGNNQQAGDSYESWDQVKKDMANPLYNSDPAFRTKVEQKMARSPNI